MEATLWRRHCGGDTVEALILCAIRYLFQSRSTAAGGDRACYTPGSFHVREYAQCRGSSVGRARD